MSRHSVEVGVVHQPLDLVGELDVAADVRVGDGTHLVTAGDRRDLVEALEHPPPPVVVEPRRGVRPTGRRHPDRVRLVDDHEDTAAGGSDERTDPLGQAQQAVALAGVMEVLEEE